MSVVELVNEQELALMVVDPVPRRVTWPFVPALLLMVATAEFDDFHVTEAVTSTPPD